MQDKNDVALTYSVNICVLCFYIVQDENDVSFLTYSVYMSIVFLTFCFLTNLTLCMILYHVKYILFSIHIQSCPFPSSSHPLLLIGRFSF